MNYIELHVEYFEYDSNICIPEGRKIIGVGTHFWWRRSLNEYSDYKEKVYLVVNDDRCPLCEEIVNENTNSIKVLLPRVKFNVWLVNKDIFYDVRLEHGECFERADEERECLTQSLREKQEKSCKH